MEDTARRGIRDLVREALLDALAVLLPVDCSGCGAPDRAVCAACLGELAASPSVTTTPACLEVVSALVYERRVRSVVLAFKEQGRTDAARHLAGPLAVAVASAVRGPCEVIAVPTSRAAWRRRGYDPVRMLLRRAGLDPGRSELIVGRRTGRQKTLDRERRARNVSGSLRARHPLTGRGFVLVDDVMTTGSTLDEAARAIRSAGGTVVGAATLAATPLRHAGAPLRRHVDGHPRSLGNRPATRGPP